MDEFEPYEKRHFVRNPLKREHLLGEFITAKPLEAKHKATNHQKGKQAKNNEVESDKFDPFSLTVNDVDIAIIQFLKKIKKFQDSAWKKNPTKAKSKLRYVCGLKEVRKQLSLGVVRCVILARDIETNNAKLAAEIGAIKEICASNHIDVFWISSKHNLCKAVSRWPVVSAVAILDYRGAEDARSAAMQTLTNFTACCRIADHADQPSLSV